MNMITRFVRSMRTGVVGSDSGFEAYYGALTRTLGNGGPSAQEARRDYQAARQSLNRTRLY